MRKNQTGFNLIELMIVIAALAIITTVGTILFVGGHFIAKFW